MGAMKSEMAGATQWMEQALQDIRFGVRSLARSPGFAASAILSLALGIGATTAIFSVIHGVILDPFPYSHPESLFSFYATVPDRNFYYSPYTPDGYMEVQQRNARVLRTDRIYDQRCRLDGRRRATALTRQLLHGKHVSRDGREAAARALYCAG